MARRGRRFSPALLLVPAMIAATVTALVVRTTAVSDPPDTVAAPLPPLVGAVEQYRADEAVRALHVALTNTRDQPIRVESLQLSLPGFDPGEAVPKDSPIPPGVTLDLATTYDEPPCTGDEAGRPVALLRVRTGDGPAVDTSVTLRDPDGVLDRILTRECRAQRLAREARVSFAPGWRSVGKGADLRLFGSMQILLLDDSTPRVFTQVLGTVIYALAPADPARVPLARVDAANPSASVPVVVSRARCTGHARGEVKKPFDFTVWLAEPGGPEEPMTISVSASDREAMRPVCPF